MSDRTSNSVKNSMTSLFSQIIIIILSFSTRTVFINVLGSDYLGINGLFSNIMSLLSFAELGIGSAITYSLYKPIAENNIKQICALTNLYAKVYKFISLVILGLGLLVIPLLDYIVESSFTNDMLIIIYVLFLLNSVLSYLFAYKRSLLIANQKSYLNAINQIKFFAFQNIFQIIVLLQSKQYILFLIIGILSSLLSNFNISKKVEILFPYLNSYDQEKVATTQMLRIKRNVIGTMSSKLGGIIVTSTDNILISIFSGISLVGIYSNYVLIINTVSSLIMQMINSITASVGNLIVSSDEEKTLIVFKRIFFINAFITQVFTIAFALLLNSFVYIWLGDDYLLKETTLYLIVINFYIIQMRRPVILFIDAFGLYWEIKWKSIFEAIINLVFSLYFLLILKMGINGVILGTLFSNILTNFWWEPYIAFKRGFKTRQITYYVIYFRYSFFFLTSLFLSYFLVETTYIVRFLGFIHRLIIVALVPSLAFILLNYKTNEFKYFVHLLTSYIHSKKM